MKLPDLSIFRFNENKIPPLSYFSEDDFKPAAEDEKEEMIRTRKSVSYWKDAMRRFKANKVSMGALFIFLLIFLFSFLGPVFVPYDYADQYRSSVRLGPGEYSVKEQIITSSLEYADKVYSTAMIPGSLNVLDNDTTYFFTEKGVTYSFYNENVIGDVIVMFSAGAQHKVSIISEADASAGMWDKAVQIDYSENTEITGRTTELKLVKRVFPHVFGTDTAGRDLMARTMYGGRVSISIGIVAALIVLVIGSVYGSVAGLAGGKVDFIMMRLVDIIYSVPDVLIVLLLQVVLKTPLQNWLDKSSSPIARSMSSLGVGIISIFITFACLYWVGMSRIVRGQVLQLKEQEFVTAARALGVPGSKIVKKHLLPNCVGQLVIATCLQIPSAIFLESFLSFLGLGVSIPMTSLGSLCSDAIGTITLYPYRLLYPGIILTILVLSLNLVGDGIRDALDPRLKK